MDFQELLMKRRAIRDYLPDPVPQTVIHEILSKPALPHSSKWATL